MGKACEEREKLIIHIENVQLQADEPKPVIFTIHTLVTMLGIYIACYSLWIQSTRSVQEARTPTPTEARSTTPSLDSLLV